MESADKNSIVVPNDEEVLVGRSSYAAFIASSPLHGEHVFNTLFDRHSGLIQTRKQKFAVANLARIFAATFEITAVSGFNKMSLRDLSKRTKMSMGAIYSCITKKEDIALMVADIVRLSTDHTYKQALQADSTWEQITQSIRLHLYASTLLQPWYFFLYFETRSLPIAQQAASKQIELDGIDGFQKHIEAGVKAGEFYTNDASIIANTIVVLLQDWYLKPWKTQSLARVDQSISEQELKIDRYYKSLISILEKLLKQN